MSSLHVRFSQNSKHAHVSWDEYMHSHNCPCAERKKHFPKCRLVDNGPNQHFLGGT